MDEIVSSPSDYYSDDMMSFSYSDNLDEHQDDSYEDTDDDIPDEYVDEDETSDEVESDGLGTEADEAGEDEDDESEPSIFDPEYFKTPDTFESQEEEVEWYRDRIATVEALLDKDSSIYESIANEHLSERVSQMDLELEGFGIMHEALQTDARGFLLQFIPEALAENGINPIMTEQQVLERAEQDLMKEFGADYRTRINHAELFDPRSFTAQVWAKQQSLIREWDIINNRNKEIMHTWNDNIVAKREQQANAPAYTQAEIDAVYQQEFKDRYDRQEFDAMISEAAQRKVTFADLEKVIKFDDFVQEAYEKGLKDAKVVNNSAYERASREGTVYTANDRRVATQPDSARQIADDFQTFFTGGIPYY